MSDASRQIVLDTETTGLNPEEGHRVIEIGAVELVNRRVTGNYFHYYLNPERAVEEAAMAVHGLSNDFLQDKPKFIDIYQEFLTFIQGTELIIHNAPFDIGFLNRELALLPESIGMLTDYCKVFDTLPFARKRYPGQRNTLDALCKRLAIDNTNRKLHGALLDAEILARVYLAMTGGQEILFSEEEVSVIAHQQFSSAIQVKKDRLLKIFLATSSEQALHREYLQALSAKSGKILWPEQE